MLDVPIGREILEGSPPQNQQGGVPGSMPAAGAGPATQRRETTPAATHNVEGHSFGGMCGLRGPHRFQVGKPGFHLHEAASLEARSRGTGKTRQRAAPTLEERGADRRSLEDQAGRHLRAALTVRGQPAYRQSVGSPPPRDEKCAEQRRTATTSAARPRYAATSAPQPKHASRAAYRHNVGS